MNATPLQTNQSKVNHNEKLKIKAKESSAKKLKLSAKKLEPSDNDEETSLANNTHVLQTTNEKPIKLNLSANKLEAPDMSNNVEEMSLANNTQVSQTTIDKPRKLKMSGIKYNPWMK